MSAKEIVLKLCLVQEKQLILTAIRLNWILNVSQNEKKLDFYSPEIKFFDFGRVSFEPLTETPYLKGASIIVAMPLTLLQSVICIKNSLLGSCKRCCYAGQDHFWNKTRVKPWNPWNTLRSTQSAHRLTFTCQPNMFWVVFHPVVFAELQLFQIKKIRLLLTSSINPDVGLEVKYPERPKIKKSAWQSIK